MSAASSSSSVFLVTGANKGIGFALVSALLERDDSAKVVMACRSAARGKQALEELPEAYQARIFMLEMDVASPSSVSQAHKVLAESSDYTPLTGIINNAGVGFGKSVEETCATNFWGTKRVCETFMPLLVDGGRVVNIASASGPNYLSRCGDETRIQQLTDKNVTLDTIEQVYAEGLPSDQLGDAYGFSKSLVNAYTRYLSNKTKTKPENNIIVNSCTPGYILTDMTRGMGATNDPEKGVKAPMHLLFTEQDSIGRGWYYGSDCARSPLSEYREPGSKPYEDEEGC